MAIRDVFKISRKTFLNPKGWLGYDSLRDQTLTIRAVLGALFTPAQATRTESYEEALQRLNLTEAEVEATAVSYRHYALTFLLFGLFAFTYAFYLLFRYVTFSGWLLGIAASALFVSQAFKYDFWAFQISKRQLGATFADWKRHWLNDKGPSA